MYINYIELDEKLNAYAIDALYDLMEKCGKYLTEEQFSMFENIILKDKIITVEKPNKEDEEFFKGNIPFAHGPRTKNDGLIHVYPYKYENQTTDEILENYIKNGVIIHELYHYVIKLDINYSEDEMRIKFGHYIEEGMVQFFAELHKKEKSNMWTARRNVDKAERIYNTLLKNGDIASIFKHNFEEIFEMYPELEILFEEYKKEEEFMQCLESIINRLSDIMPIDTKRLLSRFNRRSLADGINYLKDESIKYLESVDAEDFNKEIDTIYSNIFGNKEKRL